MNKKGFTLVELLAVFILLGIIAVIAFKVTDDLKEQSQIEALKVSAKNLFTAADNYYADNDYKNFPTNGISIKNLDIQGTSFTSGKVKLDSSGNFILVNVTDGEYCINGNIDNLEIKNEVCTGGDTDNSPLEGATKAYIAVIDKDTHEIIPIANYPATFNVTMDYDGFIIYTNSSGQIIDYTSIFWLSKITNESEVNDFKQSAINQFSQAGLSAEIHSYIDEELGFSYIFASECDLKAANSSTMTDEQYQNYCVNNLTISELEGTTITDAQLTAIGYIIINF